MYCIVIFAELLKNQPTSKVGSISSINRRRNSSIISNRSSLTVRGPPEKYGENKTLYINPNCRVQILLDFLYDVTGLDKKQQFDLCDMNGILMNLRALNEWDYATKVLDHQNTYYIVQYEYEINGKMRIEPLLQKSSKTNADLLVLLKKRLGSSATISSRDLSPKKKSASNTEGVGSVSAMKKRTLKQPKRVRLKSAT